MFKHFKKKLKQKEGLAPFETGRPKTTVGSALPNRFRTGFTLIELMISVAIIGIITAVVIFNQSDMSDRISLNNVANNMVLQARQAQVYGISVKGISNVFTNAYGVHFNINVGSGGSNAIYYTFVDGLSPGTANGYMDTTTCTVGSTECVARNYITRGNKISRICAINSSGVCNYGTIGRADITFLRPDPSALVKVFDTSGFNVTASYPGLLGVQIELTSPRGSIRTIYIYTSGQISII